MDFYVVLINTKIDLNKSTLSEYEVDGSGLRLHPVVTVVLLAVLIFRVSYLVFALTLVLLRLCYLVWSCYQTQFIKIILWYQHNKNKHTGIELY